MTYLRRYYAHRDLTPADYEAIVALVRELGHDPGDIAETFAITVNSTGVRLHLTEHLRDESGMWYMDVAADQIASRPHVHDVDPSRLPEAIRPPRRMSHSTPGCGMAAAWPPRRSAAGCGISCSLRPAARGVTAPTPRAGACVGVAWTLAEAIALAEDRELRSPRDEIREQTEEDEEADRD